MKTLLCKMREATTVDEENLEGIINEMIGQGFELDAIHFAMRESSKRPSMAFLVFYKTIEQKDD